MRTSQSHRDLTLREPTAFPIIPSILFVLFTRRVFGARFGRYPNLILAQEAVK